MGQGLKKLNTFFLVVCLLLAGSIYSQTCCSGGIPISNNIGIENIGKNSFQISLSYDFNNLNTLNAGSEELNDNSRKRTTHSVLLNASYAFTDKLSFETLLTWVNQRRIISQFGNVDTQATNGIGDAVFLVKYDVKKIIGKSSNLSLGIGAKVPFGSYNEMNDIGITYIADLQPGSGAWDLIAYTSISKNFDFRPTTTFSSRFIYRATGKNKDYLDGAQTYEYGNETQLFFTISDQFLVFKKILISPSIALKYRNAKRDEIDQIQLNNTGGNWLFFNPGMLIKLSNKVSFITRAELPIISNVDGTQLTPTYRLNSGFLINFNLKKNEVNFNNSKL